MSMTQNWSDRLSILRGDITQQQVDAVVTAANNALAGGGGVDGAVHRASGPELLQECLRIGWCPTGEARITKGYRLPARHVIHTVGPVWDGGDDNEEEKLANCYPSCFGLAVQHGLRSIAFPSISTGNYGFPVRPAARIALTEIASFLKLDATVDKVIVVCFEERVFQAYTEILQEMLKDQIHEHS